MLYFGASCHHQRNAEVVRDFLQHDKIAIAVATHRSGAQLITFKIYNHVIKHLHGTAKIFRQPDKEKGYGKSEMPGKETKSIKESDNGFSA